MGSLVMVKARLMASSAPRRVWDLIKRGLRPISRYVQHFLLAFFFWPIKEGHNKDADMHWHLQCNGTKISFRLKIDFLQCSQTAERKEKAKQKTGKKTFVCKLIYQNVFNIGLVQKKGPQGQTRQDPRQISRWPSMLVMVMVMVMMMLVMMIMVVKAKHVTFDSKTLPSYNALTRR